MLDIIKKSWLARRIYFGNKFIFPRKSFVVHTPTLRCNLNCEHCYQKEYRKKRKEEARTEDIINFYNKLPNLPVRLTGGEPFMRKDILKIVEAVGKRELDLSTNGTIIDNKLASFKDKINLKKLSISLDGPEKIHNRIRGKNAFKLLEKNLIEFRRNFPGCKISACFTIQKKNINYIKEFYEDAKKLKVDEVVIAIQSFKNQKPEFSIDELKKAIYDIKKYSISIPTIFGYESYIKNPECFFSPEGGRISCVNFKNNEIRINEKGDRVFCNNINKTFGNIKDKDFKLDNPELTRFKKFIARNMPAECERCCKSFVY